MNWDNLKYLLALYRAGSLGGAATRLSVDATTVSRRLAALQKELGVRLVEKSAEGTLELTVAGDEAVRHAEAVETALSRLGAELSGARTAEQGVVRVSSVPVVINRLLLPQLKPFAGRYPGIELHLASEVRNVSLTKRETDMAIRLGRPRDGGHNVKAKRIAVLSHAIYGPVQNVKSDLPWIGYHENMSFLPQAQWLAQHLSEEKSAYSVVRPSDLEGVIEAVAAGLGRSVLPEVIAKRDPRLQRLAEPTPELMREVWLLQHSDQVGLARMTAVGNWIEKVFSSDRDEDSFKAIAF